MKAINKNKKSYVSQTKKRSWSELTEAQQIKQPHREQTLESNSETQIWSFENW